MILNKNYVGGSDFWLNSSELNFHEIQKMSNVTEKWRLPDNRYNDKVLKPVNVYASNFSTKPTIIENKDSVTIRQKTHAEIWVQPMKSFLYALDKTMQRQFYPSELKFNRLDNCFISSYKFYTPWVIDYDIECKVKYVENSPFVLNTNKIYFNKNSSYIEPQWIHFFIKNTGSHMISKEYGIIEIETPMFDIIVDDHNIGRKILEQFR